MKIEELSIGSKILYENEVMTINSISKSGVIYTDELLNPIDINDIKGVQITEEFLLQLGFNFKSNLILNKIFDIDISHFPNDYKTISLTIERHNQFVYLREGELKEDRSKDNLITIFNSDINGELYAHHIQNIYKIHKNERLRGV